VTKFCAGTILTSQGMDCQTHAIGKAIRPIFAEPVTYYVLVHMVDYTDSSLCFLFVFTLSASSSTSFNVLGIFYR